jgi:hypothetical protein
MTQLGTRSGTQILRTFLPQQTADLKGGIYRVTEWSGAAPIMIDREVIVRRLLHEIYPWSRAHTDSGYAADLRAGATVEVVELDDRRGVQVEMFPQVWLCRDCRRVGKTRDRQCRCGQRRWGQLHFVGFHSCGAIVEPWIKRCPQHDDVKLVSPRSAQAKDMAFVCPVCNLELMRGLGFTPCRACGKGNVTWNVHKARSVYVPRGVVLINPPRPDRMKELLAAGGSRRALSWIIDGMTARSPAAMPGKQMRAAFVQEMLAKGFDPGVVENMASMMATAGQFAADSGADDIDQLPVDLRQEAEHDAVDIAMALAETRVTTVDLAETPGLDSVLADRYSVGYPEALNRAGLAGIDLVERFPVLNIMYGYTRGGGEANASRLIPFRRPRGGYRLHGDLAETEALFFRLDPGLVVQWLATRGHALPRASRDPRQARLAILGSAAIPRPGDEPASPSVGSDLLTLIHSYAHRLIRRAAVYAGIDRDALAEYLVPRHLGFFVYAAARGDFVLGGLQAVFETELHALMTAMIDGEHRCPLDPGCSRGAGACLACLHLGEPSCRYFNTFLDRKALFAGHGYLRLTDSPGQSLEFSIKTG